MYRQLQQLSETERSFALATVVEADAATRELLGKKLLVADSGVYGDLVDTSIGREIESCAREAMKQYEARLYPVRCESGNAGVLVECCHPVAHLLVLGGGHVAQPLVRIASLLQYQITVVDDRPAFANRERFPDAHGVVCDDFLRALGRQTIDSGKSVVIVTRGHQHDLACLEYVLKHEPGYVGMIGSRRRVRMIKEHLIRSGYPEDRVNRVCMPIGLPIGAQTPEEIAVSIAAQLVEARRGGAGHSAPPASTHQQWSLLRQLLDCISRGQPVAAATIVRTRGSTPRKAGAKMLVLPDGACLGTIGGGCGEAEVRREALMLFDNPGVRLHRVLLDADTAAEEGMACGGSMDVFIERFV